MHQTFSQWSVGMTSEAETVDLTSIVMISHATAETRLVLDELFNLQEAHHQYNYHIAVYDITVESLNRTQFN